MAGRWRKVYLESEIHSMVNRTPFRKVAEIIRKLIECEDLRWQLPDSAQEVVFTLDGKHFGFITDVGPLSGIWQSTEGLVFRPIGLTWKQAADVAFKKD